MGNKPDIATLIPYRIVGDSVSVYLQKRTTDAELFPGLFGFFGGKVEVGESVEDGLRREVKEELDFVPNGYEKLGIYESSKIRHIFVLEVGEDFEIKVKVLEGEYGRFFNEEEVASEPKFIKVNRPILQDLYKFVRQREKI